MENTSTCNTECCCKCKYRYTILSDIDNPGEEINLQHRYVCIVPRNIDNRGICYLDSIEHTSGCDLFERK